MLRHLSTSFLLALVCLLAACNAPEAYREALDAFSQGAALEISQDENMAKPDAYLDISALYPASTSPAPTNQKASFFYEQTLTLLGKALKGESQLAKLGILDNAYTLQALTQWRQGQYDAVEQTLSTIDTLPVNDNDPDDIRDEALRMALPGLVKLDKAYAALQASQAAMTNLSDTPDAEREAAYTKIKSYYTDFALADSDDAPSLQRGLAILDFAMRDLPRDEDIFLYLLNSKLAGLDTWGDLLFNTFTASRRLSASNFAPDESEWLSVERVSYEDKRKAGLQMLKEVLGSDTHELYRYWEGVL